MTPAQLKKLCAKWPGVTSDIKWGQDFVMSVGGKMFAVTGTGKPHDGQVSFKVPDERFLELTDLPGIVPAPYAARFKWVLVTEPKRYGRQWLEEMIRGSYELVKAKLPKRTQQQLG